MAVGDSSQECLPVAPEREIEPLGAKDGSLDHLLDSDALARFKEFLDEMLELGVPESESLSVRTTYLHALVTALATCRARLMEAEQWRDFYQSALAQMTLNHDVLREALEAQWAAHHKRRCAPMCSGVPSFYIGCNWPKPLALRTVAQPATESAHPDPSEASG
jgi:hypothetical protein